MFVQRKGGNEPYSLTSLTGHVGTKITSNNLESTTCFLGMIGNLVNVPPAVEPLPPGPEPPNWISPFCLFSPPNGGMNPH